jgi:hypothetical protein
VQRDRKWDKQNRSSLGLCPPALTAKISAGSGAPSS